MDTSSFFDNSQVAKVQYRLAANSYTLNDVSNAVPG
jgi:hypothetical protein